MKKATLRVVTDAPERKPWAEPGLSRADRVIAFMEHMPLTAGKAAGTPFRLRPWQKKIVRDIYRTDRKGRRLTRTAVVSMPRKQGKTDIAARLALCHLCGPEAEARGEVYSCANDRFQSGRIFSEMVALIEAVPWMADRVSIRRHSKELEDIGEGGTGSVFAALSADVPGKHGLSPSFAVHDELGQAASRDLFDVMDTAMGGRDEPLMVVISTQAASDNAPLSELIDYGLKVQAGDITDPAFHLTLFTAPPDADPWSEKTWRIANPALGDFRSLEDVRRLAQQAQRTPSKESAFRNLILNQRVDAEAQFLSRAVWVACQGPVDPDALEGLDCWAALDWGATRDLTALVLVFRHADDRMTVLPFFWLPADGLRDRDTEDRVSWTVWAREGHLHTVPGKTNDPAAVARVIAELHGRFNIRALAYDRWRIEDLRRELAAIGCDVVLEPHGQGFRDMSPALEVLERRVIGQTINVGENPVLTMCASNAVTQRDPAGNRKLAKDKSRGRIDGLVATAMALAIAERHGGPVENWSPVVEMF
jgi:phage terminase large subunit-like protein